MGTPSHLGHRDRVATTMPSQAHAGAAQEAPDIGRWEEQDVPLVRPSSCNVKGGILSSRRYLPTYLWCCLPSSVSLVPPSLALPHGVVLAVACGCAPFPACVPRSTAGYPPSAFVIVALFILSSTLCQPARLPGVHFSLPPPLCLPRLFPLPTSSFSESSSFSPSWSCETEHGWGCGPLQGWRYRR